MAAKKHHRKARHKSGAAGAHHKRRRVSGTKTTRRRRRVGAHEKMKDAVLMAAGVAAGAIVTPFIVQGITTAMGSGASAIPAWMVPGGGFATGAIIMGVSKGNHLVAGFGAGMAAIGAVMAANEIGLSEPGISGTAFSNNAAPGAVAVTRSVGCNNRVGSPQKFVNNSVGSTDRMQAMAVGALYSN